MSEHLQRYTWFLRDHDPNGKMEQLRLKIKAAGTTGMPVVSTEDAVKLAEYTDKLILALMYPVYATAGA